MSTLKASSLTFRPPPSTVAELQDEWGSQHHIDLAKCAFRLVYKPPPHSTATPSSPAAYTLTAPDFVSGERGQAQMSRAAAPGPRHSSAQKRREGRGLGALLCRAPSIVFLLFVPIDEGVEVLAVAFV